MDRSRAKSFIASPVASDERIYIIDEEGTLFIIQDGDSFKLLAEIPFNDICLTAPAITDGMIYFRTQKYILQQEKNDHSFLRIEISESFLTLRTENSNTPTPVKKIDIIMIISIFHGRSVFI